MIQKLYLFLLFLIFASANAQDSQLFGGCKYLEVPMYLISGDEVIFENCTIHRDTEIDVKNMKVYENGFAMDQKNIYFMGLKMDALKDGFEIFPRYSYQTETLWRNTDFLFIGRKKILKIDPRSFKYLSDGYFINDGSVYLLDKKIENADAETFVVENNISFDNNSAFKNGEILKHNGKNLKPLNNNFVKDDAFVYKVSYDKFGIVEKIDSLKASEAFAIPKTNYAIIKGFLYNGDIKMQNIGAKKDEITVQSKNLLKFKDFVIFRTYLIKSLDINSLEAVDDNYILKDKNGVYSFSNGEYYSSRNFNLEQETVTLKKLDSLSQKEVGIQYEILKGITIKSDIVYYEDEVFLTKKDVENSKLKDLYSLKMVSILKGYRKGCSQDSTPSSNTMIVKNSEGFWSIYKTHSKTTIDFIGKTYKY